MKKKLDTQDYFHLRNILFNELDAMRDIVDFTFTQSPEYIEVMRILSAFFDSQCRFLPWSNPIWANHSKLATAIGEITVLHFRLAMDAMLHPIKKGYATDLNISKLSMQQFSS